MKAQQLKNAILQLAIQGKLVPQDPNDEPASQLLEKIEQEKAKLIAEGKIKKSKKTTDTPPYPKKDEIPFEIPESWVWVRLGDISQYIQRGKSPKYVEYSNYPVISQKCIQWEGFNLEKVKFIDEESLESYSEERILQDEDLLWNSTGLGTLGRIAIYFSNLNPYDFAVADSHVTVIRPYKNILSKYIYIYLSNPTVQLVIEDQADGSTKQKELSLKTIKNYLIPLPPSNEQKRIVEQIEKLLPFIEQYDKKEQQLTALNQQFPEQLKKSILQSAIQGKLVPQNPNDEPASELIKRIQQEKKRLISAKKLKKPKTISEIIIRDNLPYEIIDGVERCIADEVPFENPENWAWVRLGEILKIYSGVTYSKLDQTTNKSDLRVVRGGNILNNNLELFDNDVRINKKNIPKEQMLSKWDIITPSVTSLENIGKFALINDDLFSVAFGGFIFCLRRYRSSDELLYIKYIFYLLCSEFVREQMKYKTNKSGQAFYNLSKTKFEDVMLVIPPLNEQKRIVEKIELLFSKLPK